MAIVINGSGTVTGISVGGLPDGIVDAGTLATDSVDSAELIDGSIDSSHLASGVGGLSEADQWRMHSGFTSPSADVSDISNWERPDTGGGGGYVGTGMSHSSGVWTFPSTGQYLIDFHITGSSTADVRYIKALINTTTDNGSAWYVAADGRSSLNPESSWWYTGVRVTFLFDVTNVSTHKVKLSAGGENNNLSINGSSSGNETYVTFLKLGET